ncbi:hypothetical protein BN1723_020762 [Verticillium longisporum]|uniref:Uncharacterized protein n=1 Tax=Verticillium longisporum TaxID=100787 RepID=A0A0G4KH56_VERLO|nr:hypothetical protein BN1723_020762 [Verticillium longisporum]
MKSRRTPSSCWRTTCRSIRGTTWTTSWRSRWVASSSRSSERPRPTRS